MAESSSRDCCSKSSHTTNETESQNISYKIKESSVRNGDNKVLYRLSMKLPSNVFSVSSEIPNARAHFGVTKKGYLQKLSSRGFPYIPTPWKRKYCVLVKGILYYYEKEDSKGVDKGNGIINLEYYDQVIPAPPKDSKKATHAFLLHAQDKSFFDPGRHLFSADSSQNMNEWIRHLKKAIEQIRINNRTNPSAAAATAAHGCVDSASSLNIATQGSSNPSSPRGPKGGVKQLVKRKEGTAEGGKENKENLPEDFSKPSADSAARRRRANPSSRSMDDGSLDPNLNIARKKAADSQDPNSAHSSLGRKQKTKSAAFSKGKLGGGDFESNVNSSGGPNPFSSLGRQMPSNTAKSGAGESGADTSGCSGTSGASGMERRKRKAEDEDVDGDLMGVVEAGPHLESVTKHRVKGPAGRRMPQNRRTHQMKHRASSLSALGHNAAEYAGSQDNASNRSDNLIDRYSCTTNTPDDSVNLSSSRHTSSATTDDMLSIDSSHDVNNCNVSYSENNNVVGTPVMKSTKLESLVEDTDESIVTNGDEMDLIGNLNKQITAKVKGRQQKIDQINDEDIDDDGVEDDHDKDINDTSCENNNSILVSSDDKTSELLSNDRKTADKDDSNKILCEDCDIKLKNTSKKSSDIFEQNGDIANTKNNKPILDIDENESESPEKDTKLSDESIIEDDVRSENKNKCSNCNKPLPNKSVMKSSQGERTETVEIRKKDSKKHSKSTKNKVEKFPSTAQNKSKLSTKPKNRESENVLKPLLIETIETDTFDDIDDALFFKPSWSVYNEINQNGQNESGDDNNKTKSKKSQKTKRKRQTKIKGKHASLDGKSVRSSMRSNTSSNAEVGGAFRPKLSRFRQTIVSFRRVKLGTDSTLCDEHPDEILEGKKSSYCAIL